MNRHETRRAVIREWMALPRDKRQTEEQTRRFCRESSAAPRTAAQPPRPLSRDGGLVAATDREAVICAQSGMTRWFCDRDPGRSQR
jgi:hypothetical protein